MYNYLDLQPGINKDDSPLASGRMGYYIDADKIRFVNGKPQTIGGWEKASTTQLLGFCRGAITWSDNARAPYAAFGTHLREYVMDLDGTVTDITPVTSYSGPTQTSISFSTVISTTTVTAAWTAHGLVAGQKFKLENATVTSVGGVTINGTYAVDSVADANTITYTAVETATSTAGPTASSVDTTIYLAPGNADGTLGRGYGTGSYGSGGFSGTSTASTIDVRTWSMAPWGQNLLSNPRQGGIYEWAPNTSTSELVTNDKFTAAASWSATSGVYTIESGAIQFTAGAGSFSQSVTLNTAAWHLFTIKFSTAGGALTPTHGGTAIGSAISAGAGMTRVEFFSNGGSEKIEITKDSATIGRVTQVSVQVLTTGSLVTGAPTQVGSMFVTPQRQVVACGSNLDGSFDALQVDWSDTENNQQWSAGTGNLAGGYTLPAGGRIVRGESGPQENLLWTQEALWSMRFNGTPTTVYDFQELGKGCGLIGPNAVATAHGDYYWMTPAGAFMRYSGGFPEPIPSTLSRDVLDNLAYVQQDKIYAHRRSGPNYSEIWWRYPDSRDGSEVSRYIIYDILGGSWSCGTWDRTACADATDFEYPLSVDTSGYIWFEEKGFSADGAARSWSLDMGFVSKDNGQLILNGIRPDTDDQQGGYTITPYSVVRNATGISTRTYSAMSILTTTGQKNCRVKGEEIRLKFSGTAAPCFWRQGAMKVDVIQSGAQR